MTRRDVVGIAQTGTGKTAAFALPILHYLHAEPRRPERKFCRVLVLSPTRELSGQIEDSFRTYGRHVRVSTTLAIGGVPMGKQVRALMNGVDVLVATPGRLLDLVKSNALKLDRVEILVLDEADRMLDMGFIHDIRKIVAKLPRQRQTLFFSATMPQDISELADAMLTDPVKVAVTPVASTVERVTQRMIHVDRASKATVLAEVLRHEPVDRALVFTRTKHGADKVVRQLNRSGIPAEAIHGNKSQGQRERVLAAFRKGDVRTLVATDIAARGIDVDGISHVVNYDLPNIPETYVHRIGRTARAGADGMAISLCDADERAYVRDIERLIRMTIPATDQRGTPRPAPSEARPQRHPEGPSKGRQSPRQGRSKNGQSPRRDEHQGAGQPARNARTQSRGSSPQAARPQDARSQDARREARPHEAKPRNAQPRDSQPQNGRSRNARPPKNAPVRYGIPETVEWSTHKEAAQRSAPQDRESGMGGVAFMQRRPRPHRDGEGRTPR
jgi:ATP-dependent RNA helicase RhlE